MGRFVSVALWLMVVSLVATVNFGVFGPSVHWWLSH